MVRIQAADMEREFTRVLASRGLSAARAAECARVFVANSLDGVYSHGVNRFAKTVSNIERGFIDPKAEATVEKSFGCMERWNGNRGMGIPNAARSMSRAIELSASFGVGCVALANTNHWLRGGTYGWQAADAGRIGVCFTNTLPNMPAWGARDRRLGNNPLVIAIPRAGGNHVVVDCAMSQFSYGKLEETRMKGEQLPFPGGFDEEGKLTLDPGAIEKTRRVLPIGYWKGSGLSLALDLIATLLSAGNSVADIGKFGGEEYAVSQVFIAIDPSRFNEGDLGERLVESTIAYLKGSESADGQGEVTYPGERTMRTRRANERLGIPVDDGVWAGILAL